MISTILFSRLEHTDWKSWLELSHGPCRIQTRLSHTVRFGRDQQVSIALSHCFTHTVMTIWAMSARRAKRDALIRRFAPLLLYLFLSPSPMRLLGESLSLYTFKHWKKEIIRFYCRWRSSMMRHIHAPISTLDITNTVALKRMLFRFNINGSRLSSSSSSENRNTYKWFKCFWRLRKWVRINEKSPTQSSNARNKGINAFDSWIVSNSDKIESHGHAQPIRMTGWRLIQRANQLTLTWFELYCVVDIMYQARKSWTTRTT